MEKKTCCPMCNKETGVIEKNDNVDLNRMLYSNICEECKQIMSEWVTLVCMNNVSKIEGEEIPCMSVTVVNTDKFKEHWIECVNGDIIHIKWCPICSIDRKFHII